MSVTETYLIGDAVIVRDALHTNPIGVIAAINLLNEHGRTEFLILLDGGEIVSAFEDEIEAA